MRTPLIADFEKARTIRMSTPSRSFLQAGMQWAILWPRVMTCGQLLPLVPRLSAIIWPTHSLIPTVCANNINSWPRLRRPRRAPELNVTRKGDSLCQKECYPRQSYLWSTVPCPSSLTRLSNWVPHARQSSCLCPRDAKLLHLGNERRAGQHEPGPGAIWPSENPVGCGQSEQCARVPLLCVLRPSLS